MPFALICFWIRSLISILSGVLAFDVSLLGTLEVGAFGIVFSIVAAWSGSVLVRCGCSVTLGVGAASLGSVFAGAFAALPEVTLHCVGLVSVVAGVGSGSLLRIVSRFFSALI